MSRVLYREQGAWWGAAFLCATTLHGAGLAMYFDVVPWRGWRSPAATISAEITVASLIVPAQDLAAAQAPEAVSPPPEPAPPPEPEPAPAPPPQPDPVAEPAPPAEPEPELPQPEPAPPPPPAPPEATENPLLSEGDSAGNGALDPGPEGTAPAPPPEDLPNQEPPPEEPLASEPTAPEPPPETPPAAVASAGPGALAAPIVAPPPPSPDTEALRRLVSRIRGQFGDSCLVALPQITPGRAPGVVMLSDRDRSMVDFSAAVLPDPESPETPPLGNRAVLVDARQCPAVNFLRTRRDYPAFGLSLGLVSAEVFSGGRLIGSIEGGAEGAHTSLLLVDDNGVVQDLRRFLRFSGGRTEFEVPVTRDGDARDTSQLLIALATPARLDTVTNLAGRLAKDFFGPLQKELGDTAAIAVLPFDLR